MKFLSRSCGGGMACLGTARRGTPWQGLALQGKGADAQAKITPTTLQAPT